MEITFKSYARRDGSIMLYINRSNGVSVGISADRGFSPYGKGVTEGQRNAVNAALATFRAHAAVFTGDLSKHIETGFCAPVSCGNYTLVGTDIATIGGMSVGADGAYIVRDGMILRCGTYDEPDSVDHDA